VRFRTGLLALLAALVLPTATAVGAGLPRAVITSGPSGDTESSEATFTFEASQPPLLNTPRFECSIDTGAFVACVSPLVLDSFGGGSHSFAVRMTGIFDDHTPDTRNWTVQQRTVVAPPPLPPSKQPPAPHDKRKPHYAVDGCDYGAAGPHQATATQLRRATICLFNRVRADHGLRPVRRSARLATLAQGYAGTLARYKFFSHTTPAGRTFAQRVYSARYVRGTAWEVGEVLAWAPGRPTPHREVLAWLNSPPHREIILTGAYRDVGVGVTFAAPRRGVRRGATYVGEFGHVG
jgi:uncharacterized protein YkwD